MTKTPSIAFILPSMKGGGAERVAITLAETLQQHGWDVELIVYKKEGEFISHIPQTLRVFSLEAENSLRAGWKLRKHLKKTQPQHAMSFLYPACIALVLATVKSGLKTKTWLRLDNTLSVHLKYLSRTRGWRIRKFFLQADAIIAVSQGVADDYKALEKNHQTPPVSVIYNPIPVQTISAQSLEEPSQKLPFATPTLPLLVGVGRLSHQKDFGTLINAVKHIHHHTPVNLLLIGKGEDEDALKQQVKELQLTENIHFIGFQDNPFPYLRMADLFVLSSRYEGFGNVLVEAMACGTQIVSTDCPNGPAEILDNGRYGLLTPVGDAVTMGQNICKSLQNSVPEATLKERAEIFDAERIFNDYLTHLQ